MLSAISVLIMQYLVPLALIVFLLGVVKFIHANKALFKSSKLHAILMVLPGVILVPCISSAAGNSLWSSSEVSTSSTIISAVCFFGLMYTFLSSMRQRVIVNYLQPLVLCTSAVILMAVGSISTFVLCSIALFLEQPYTVGLAIVVFTIFDLVLAWWIASRKMCSFENVEYTASVFENGEADYSTFRLPVIIALDKAVVAEKCGIEAENDPIFAFAEGRKSSSKDLGNIDILAKVSTNNGKSWSMLKTVLTLGDVDGKMGNPTVAFDKVNGKIIFMYLQAKKQDGYTYATYCCRGTLTSELDIELDEPTLVPVEINEKAKNKRSDGVTENTLMCGPGKGIQIPTGENAGRILMPCSNRGESFVMYSDDFGYTWTKSEPAGEGNECEVTVLESGTVVLVSRDNKGCTSKHNNYFQKISFSNDSGSTWFECDYQTELPTPICMTSIENINGEGVYMSYPHDHLTRCNLSVAVSTDEARSFDAKTIFAGPAGYSCLTTNSSGDLFCMAEVGKVNYNEMLVFAKISK